MNRRTFLSGCSAAIAAMAGSQLHSMTFSAADNNPEIFILVFLRGGMDGLHLIAPVSDKNYIDSREIALRITESGSQKGLPLINTLSGQDFYLHPKAQPFKELYDSKQLAIIHACGLTNGTRSHFDAMDLIDKGVADTNAAPSTGWLTRLLETIPHTGKLPAISATPQLPVSLLGSTTANSLYDPKGFTLNSDPRFTGILKNLYHGDSALARTAQQTLQTIQYIQGKLPRKNGTITDYVPDNIAHYPSQWQVQELTQSFKTLAQLIKMDVGLQVATIDFGGWDMHEGQTWLFPVLLEGFAQALTAFYNDIHLYHKRVTIAVMSEFGRRLRSNKSNGTDHGYGNAMLVLGGNVKGGTMYGKWPGLATEQLDNRVDLAVTTDYRTILSEICIKRLHTPAIQTIFPGFIKPQLLNFLS
ncbi:DUF1501 domain-containing protein [Xanthocytophaga agilis]|uniref:DUF1501 domain-containing protein n=1 Tax=Xanthocytophaga agilis TaxID=3048010 RepID=A0AAE3UFW7_9BACT|nr:DUF1501 domain-containing protein [Xanthocytophaga agilis]MDJ1501767.1 DUF1501 domain-containing protein [Xanthocytophaga agilis]